MLMPYHTQSRHLQQANNSMLSVVNVKALPRQHRHVECFALWASETHHSYPLSALADHQSCPASHQHVLWCRGLLVGHNTRCQATLKEANPCVDCVNRHVWVWCMGVMYGWTAKTTYNATAHRNSTLRLVHDTVRESYIYAWLIGLRCRPESMRYCSAFLFHIKILPFPILFSMWFSSVPPMEPTMTICFTPASLARSICVFWPSQSTCIKTHFSTWLICQKFDG